MKYKLLLVLMLLIPFWVFAQDIEVKKFEPMAKDQTAALSPRKDINGVTCGLVKVQLKEPGAEFEGNVMGDVQFTGNEYLVYLPNGTKRLGIKHPDYLPTTIVFADYGTKKVASSTTYELKVKTNKKQAKVDNSKKGMAVFNIKPSNAMLLIDGQVADGSGGAYTLSLPYGTHYYTVKLKDFSITNQQVKIDKNAKNINVDLTEYFAKVSVSCGSTDADIIVNNEGKGVGKWSGLIVPGKCTVEAQKEGFHPLSKTFELMDGDSIGVDFSELKAITGTLRVENKLKGCEVYLNGENVGTTPWVKKNLPIGEYTLEIKKEYYTTLKMNIVINEDQELTVNENLSQTQLDKILMLADDNNPFAMGLLADLYLFGIDCVKKCDYWGEFAADYGDEPIYIADRVQLLREGCKLEKDIQKASYWAKKLYGEEHPNFGFYFSFNHLTVHLMISYLLGAGVKQDFNQSFLWAYYENGPDSDKNLMYHTITHKFWLAWHYYYGKGVQRDVDKALVLLNDLRYLDKRNNGSYYTVKDCNSALFSRLFKELGHLMFTDERLPNQEEDLLRFINQY